MPRESKRARIQRMHEEYALLVEAFPHPKCALDFTSPLQLLIATVLSAQTTDKRVNTVTPELFSRFPDAASLAAANPQDVEDIIHPLGFYRSKTKHLLGLAVVLRDRFDGEVPDTMDSLVTLPGVGRKTANVVLGNAFGVPGFPVDTHVDPRDGTAALARRLELVQSRSGAYRAGDLLVFRAVAVDRPVAPADSAWTRHLSRRANPIARCAHFMTPARAH